MAGPLTPMLIDAGSPGRTLRVGNRAYPVVLPSIHDARLHLASVIISIHVLGQVAFGFAVSVPQILAAIVTCALMDVVRTLRRESRIVWPASAMLTGSGIGLILRAVGTEPGDHWTFDHWYWFAAVAAFSMVSKWTIRRRGSHVFNPSNLGLVVAFLVLGSSRVEPLDFWWVGFGPSLAAAYVIILTGGVVITRRLGLLGMGVAFWSTLAAGLGLVALWGHSITTRWSILPVEGAHFWWIVMTSPEILVFLFFMLTDPRTVPIGRVARLVFGVAVGVLATVLIAPQRTEFGAKVALLGALVVACGARYAIVARLPAPDSTSDRPSRYFVSTFGSTALGPRWIAPLAVTRALCITPLLGLVVVGAGMRAREAHTVFVVDETEVVPDVASLVPCPGDRPLPSITVDSKVTQLDHELVGPAVDVLARALLCDLDAEAEALRRREPQWLPAVDHGARLQQMRETIDHASGGSVEVAELVVESMRLTVVRPPGQSSPVIGIEASGTMTVATVTANGSETRSAPQAFTTLFSLRHFTNGSWRIVAARPA